MSVAREEDAQYGLVPAQQHQSDYMGDQSIVHLFAPGKDLSIPTLLRRHAMVAYLGRRLPRHR
jgi:hypothetical protein